MTKSFWITAVRQVFTEATVRLAYCICLPLYCEIYLYFQKYVAKTSWCLTCCFICIYFYSCFWMYSSCMTMVWNIERVRLSYSIILGVEWAKVQMSKRVVLLTWISFLVLLFVSIIYGLKQCTQVSNKKFHFQSRLQVQGCRLYIVIGIVSEFLQEEVEG